MAVIDCDHPEVRLVPEVARLKDQLIPGGRAVTTGWYLSLEVFCAECGVALRWVGIPAGVHETKPGTNLEGTRLYAPLTPAAVARTD